MDYEGQKLAELIFYILILTFGCIGWVIGYVQEDFTVVFQAWLAGVVISVIVSYATRKVLLPFFIVLTSSHFCIFILQQLCVPDWPFYNRNPIKWLESVPDRRQHAKSS